MSIDSELGTAASRVVIDELRVEHVREDVESRYGRGRASWKVTAGVSRLAAPANPVRARDLARTDGPGRAGESVLVRLACEPLSSRESIARARPRLGRGRDASEWSDACPHRGGILDPKKTGRADRH